VVRNIKVQVSLFRHYGTGKLVICSIEQVSF